MDTLSCSDRSYSDAVSRIIAELEQRLSEETRFEPPSPEVDILLPEHFVSIVRGRTHIRNTGLERECRIEMTTRNEAVSERLVAVFGCRARGWLDKPEVAILNTGKRVLVWRRIGKVADMAIDGNRVGRMELGWWMRLAYIGCGNVWLNDEPKPFCRFTLPILGPSSPQPRDCTGQFTFTRDRKSIKFLISPGDAERSTPTLMSALAWGWARLRGRGVPIPEGAQPWQPSRSGRTIFYPSDQCRLAELSSEQRLILLALAVWYWALYKGGGT